MNNLSKEEQLLAVKKVLEEMRYAQNFLKSWNLGWWEQLSNAYCLPIYEDVDRSDVLDMEEKYKSRYNLIDSCFNNKGIGVPLCSEILTRNNSLSGENDINYSIDFGEINWYGIKSKNSERRLIFSNDGDIHFFKEAKNNNTAKHPRRISYDTHFNVLREWFKINITISNLIPIKNKIYLYNYITISASENHIIMNYNNIQIIYNLNDGTKTIKTEQKNFINNKIVLVSYELRLNQTGILEVGNVIIKVKGCSGKVIGTYRFDVSENKGVRANFYSKKGKAFSLDENPELLDKAKNLLPSLEKNHDISTILINNFVSSVEDSINKGLDNVDSINNNLDINSINIIETKIVDTLKNIKGELPLKGLLGRIDYYLELLEKLNTNLVSNNSKKRELSLNKKLV